MTAVCYLADPRTAPPRAAVATARVSRTPASDRPDVRVFRRRRAVTLFVVAVVALAAPAVTATLRQSLAGPGGGALTTAGSAGATPMLAAAARVHVVQPGETLWSIAQAEGVTGDPRPVVDQLARQVGDRPLTVGQRLVLP